MDEERVIFGEVNVNASISDVWHAWTTEEGIKTFFAPGCNVVLEPNQPYEIFFFPENEPGFRGAENTHVLAVQPKKMLSFTWDAPPTFPEIRKQRTHITLRLYEIDETHTRVTLRQAGWGDGEQWDQAFEYFDDAWNKTVLPRLKYRFENGPVDWQNLPKNT